MEIIKRTGNSEAYDGQKIKNAIAKAFGSTGRGVTRQTLDNLLVLVEQKLEHPLDPAFVRATWMVWSHLIRDPLIFDMVDLDSQIREEEGWPVDIVYP